MTIEAEVINGDKTIILSRRASLRLLEWIETPPPRNEKFLLAQARYRKIKNPADSMMMARWTPL
jgi:uncharacterized protein (DUF1778 family)